jgi:hypothetical protein
MTQNNEPYNKRRLFPRFKIPAYFRPAHPFGQKQEIQDIGLGGMRVYGNRPLRLGKEMDIKLFLPNGKTMDARARISWVNTLPPGSDALYDIGYEFIELPPETHQELKSLLEDASAEE